MNLVKTLKTAAAISAIALSFVSAPSFATVGVHADASLGVKTCRNGSECTDPNGPSLGGFVGATDERFGQAPSIRTCPKGNADCSDPNGPSLDGFAGATDERFGQAPSIRTCPKGNADCSDPNGPSVDGFASTVSQAPWIRTCPKGNADCTDPNGPSLDGLIVAARQSESIGIRTGEQN